MVSFPGTLGVINAPRLLSALRIILCKRSVAEREVAAVPDVGTQSADRESWVISTVGPLTALRSGGETDEA